MSLLNSIKAAQRVINTSVDDDYQQMINACINDLIRLGISEDKAYDENDIEVIQACKLYAHWMTDYEGKGDQWGKMYGRYTNALALCQQYLEGDYDV